MRETAGQQPLHLLLTSLIILQRILSLHDELLLKLLQQLWCALRLPDMCYPPRCARRGKQHSGRCTSASMSPIEASNAAQQRFLLHLLPPYYKVLRR